MFYSRYFIPTTKDTIKEDEARNYQLLAKGGFVRRSKSGQYIVLPVGKRFLDRLYEYINLPIKMKSGVETGRGEPEILLESILGDLGSYKDIPVILYSRYTKNFVRRPRYGIVESARSEMMGGALIGGHGFADACVGLDDALLKRLLHAGLRAGMASRSSICSPEISDMILFCPNENGSYNYLRCEKCGETYDIETIRPDFESYQEATEPKPKGILRMVETKQIRTIAELEKFFMVDATEFIKTMIFIAEGKPLGVLVRGDRTVSMQKLMCAVGTNNIRQATDEEVEVITGAQVGFAGPVGLEIRLAADVEVLSGSFIAGANLTDYHLANVTAERDFHPLITGDIRCVAEGDACSCGGSLKLEKGFQIGSVEYFGPSWFERNENYYTKENGEKAPYEGATYSVDLSAVSGLLMEACDNGKYAELPQELAPFDVVIIIANAKDEVQVDLAVKLSGELKKRGLQPLVDDREARIGVKFNDAEVMGVPLKVVCGKRAAEGIVEVMEVSSGSVEVPYENVMEMLSIYENEESLFD